MEEFISSKRSRGKPSASWVNSVEEDLGTAGVSKLGNTTERQRRPTEKIVSTRSLAAVFDIAFP